MKRRLTSVEWESICEHAEGRRAAGAAWHEIGEELAASGVTEEDLDALERKHRRWARRETKRTASATELSGHEAGEEQTAYTLESDKEEVRTAMRYVFGDGIVSMKPVWRGPVHRTLRPGDRVEVVKRRGPAWMNCAVCIYHADGSREVLAEHRIRQRIKAGWMGTVNDSLKMEVLDFEEGLNTQGLVRRAAAIAYGYFAERSGVKSASHLAKVSGVERQAVHAGQVKLRAEHAERTGAPARAMAGQVPGRRKKETGRQPEVSETITDSTTEVQQHLPTLNTNTAALCHQN